jgi:hypothetical protein
VVENNAMVIFIPTIGNAGDDEMKKKKIEVI